MQEILDKQANRLKKNGKVLTTTKEQLARWAEHIKELLNRPPPNVTPEINRTDEELKINLNLPSKTEIKQAIKKLKTAKASGPDNIPPEALRANPDSKQTSQNLQ